MTETASKRPGNHLIAEKSPYLLQHAQNPVDWFPWAEPAFEKACRENKPVFLSVGYSTCHWCHVMERESFSNPEIARVLNDHFVAIKVDREERPDVDRIYMTSVQAMTGQGGWPLNAFLTPGLKPFFGGTYFPPESRWGRPGFKELLERIAFLWSKDRAKLEDSAEKLGRDVEKYLAGPRETPGTPPAILGSAARPDAAALLRRGFESYERTFVPDYGGFSGAPKFPMPVNHNFLLRYYARTGEPRALELSVKTLEAMARGGIRDHLGGGFHRYSTDARWHVPHFEKMLYDNAQIAVNYAELYQITREPEWAGIARETIDYVLRDLSHPEGGFYSAEDADSPEAPPAGDLSGARRGHGAEGAFYLWKREEIVRALGPEAGAAFCDRYGVEEDGNAREDLQGEFRGKNILYQARTLSESAVRLNMPPAQLADLLKNARKTLFFLRQERPRPFRDDKILASWNGLMITALARASQILEEPVYAEAADKAARFLRERLYDSAAGRLYRRWREGERKVPAMTDDYAFVVQGLLDLYETSFDAQWLSWALQLTEEQQRLFEDKASGGLYATAPGDDARLFAAVKEDSDNVEPSANSAAALNLLRLGEFLDREDFRESARRIISAFSQNMLDRPQSLPNLMAALDRSLSRPLQIVIAGKMGASDTQALLREIRTRFLPNKIVILADGGEGQKFLEERLEFLKGVRPPSERASAYVCRNYTCRLPVVEPERLGSQLDEAVALPETP